MKGCLRLLGAPCQVDLGFDGEHSVMQPRGTKRALEDTTSSTRRQRHMAWLNRGRFGVAQSMSWRPVKYHRVAAKRWLSNLDNGIRCTTGGPGLALFSYDAARPERAGWRTWPFLGISQDLGSDGNCGYHFAAYALGLSVLQFGDPSHGANRDLTLSLKDAGFFSLWLLCMVSWNLPFGPDRTDERRHQISDAMKSLFATETLGSCDLFQAMAPAMLADLAAMNVELPGQDSPENELWAWLAERDIFRRSGRRAELNRFMGSLETAQYNVLFWHVDLFERTFVALECDMLRGQGMQQKLVLKCGEAERVGEGGGSTSAARLTLEDRSLKSCCENCVAISVMVLSDETNRKIAQIVIQCASPVRRWHGFQNKTIRSAPASRDWMLQQTAGQYMAHIREVIAQLSSPEALQNTGFVLSADEACAMGNDGAAFESQFADIFAIFCLSLASCRMRRGMWMVLGWTMRMNLIFKDEPTRAQTIEASKEDLSIWRRFQARQGKTAAEKQVEFDVLAGPHAVRTGLGGASLPPGRRLRGDCQEQDRGHPRDTVDRG